MKLPAEVLPARDVERLLAVFGPSRIEVRNYAITLLIYRAGLKVCDVLALERRHFEPGKPTLIVPARKRAPEREILLDTPTQEALGRWAAVRKELGVRPTAPLMCSATKGAVGRRVLSSYVREMLKDKAAASGIDRRVTAEGLRQSGKAHRQYGDWRMELEVGRYLDDLGFRQAFPDAHEHWRSALDRLPVRSPRHATAVGHDCREAMAAFVNAALDKRRLRAGPRAGTITRLRLLVNEVSTSERLSDYADALVRYWGSVSDLAQRQVHGAKREKESLTEDDARRLVFHTMIVMFEVARLASLVESVAFSP